MAVEGYRSAPPIEGVIKRAFARLRELTTNTLMFAERVTYYSQGDMNNPVYIDADVSWADEEGDNSVRGDGRSTLNQGRGRKIRSTVYLEVESSRKYNENGKDQFRVTDQDGSEVLVSLQRRAGTDEATQTLICVRSRELASQPGRREG